MNMAPITNAHNHHVIMDYTAALIATLLAATYAYATLMGIDVPDGFQAIVLTIVGFFFGRSIGGLGTKTP